MHWWKWSSIVTDLSRLKIRSAVGAETIYSRKLNDSNAGQTSAALMRVRHNQFRIEARTNHVL